MKYIPLSQNKTAIVDDKDYGYLIQWKWYLVGGYAGRGVWRTELKSKRPVYLHRLLLDAPSNMHIDHINRDKLDNRRANLRLCTRSQNNSNTGLRASNKSGYKGVCWNKEKKKWTAFIMVNKVSHYLGAYEDVTRAYEEYKKAAVKYHGQFASLENASRK